MTREEREAAALAWIAPYSGVEHLLRTRKWVLELRPGAPEALELAALTHEVERLYPGGPRFEPATQAPDDFEYRWQHSIRSAQVVHEWLRQHGATERLVADVEALILLHEFGGDEDANVLQAADSISFLETNLDLVAGWVRSGRCTPERAKEQHRWMYERIRLPAAKKLASPYLERALATVDLLAA